MCRRDSAWRYPFRAVGPLTTYSRNRAARRRSWPQPARASFQIPWTSPSWLRLYADRLDMSYSRLYRLEMMNQSYRESSRWRYSAFLVAALRKLNLAAFCVFYAGFSALACAAEPVVSRTADVEGVKLHYLMAGHGAPV